ncbi:MAG TPA: hypothetical protein VH414_10095 [Lichenihabitans sp.]|jgi:hypothetical protein|nr:hypothetical protein [Lichenihabitans sp.]
MTMPRCCLALLLAACAPPAAAAQDSPPASAAATTPAPQPGLMTLTIFLRHDESQTLGEINDRLRRQHYFESFPPKGVEVLSWTVVMGIGQVVTLRFPAERLREVNRAIEQTAWGGYRTEFYPTYDYRPTAAQERQGLPSAFK